MRSVPNSKKKQKTNKKKRSCIKFIQVLSTSGANCGSNNDRLFKEQKSVEILKILRCKKYTENKNSNISCMSNRNHMFTL